MCIPDGTLLCVCTVQHSELPDFINIIRWAIYDLRDTPLCQIIILENVKCVDVNNFLYMGMGGRITNACRHKYI